MFSEMLPLNLKNFYKLVLWEGGQCLILVCQDHRSDTTVTYPTHLRCPHRIEAGSFPLIGLASRSRGRPSTSAYLMNIKAEGEEPDVSFGPVSLEAYLASGSKQTHIRTMNNIHPSHLEGWYLPSFPASRVLEQDKA